MYDIVCIGDGWYRFRFEPESGVHVIQPCLTEKLAHSFCCSLIVCKLFLHASGVSPFVSAREILNVCNVNTLYCVRFLHAGDCLQKPPL